MIYYKITQRFKKQKNHVFKVNDYLEKDMVFVLGDAKRPYRVGLDEGNLVVLDFEGHYYDMVHLGNNAIISNDSSFIPTAVITQKPNTPEPVPVDKKNLEIEESGLLPDDGWKEAFEKWKGTEPILTFPAPRNRERETLAMMAATIAAGFCTNPNHNHNSDVVAEDSIRVARAILRQIATEEAERHKEQFKQGMEELKKKYPLTPDQAFKPEQP